MHHVVALCLDGLVAFDLTAAVQVFIAASEEDGMPLYEVSTCSPGGAEVTTTTGFALRPQADLDALAGADTIVVPGYFA
ncbi:MAG: AraC family transcriptional regulator, partial [Solirubrobacterales bacterium]